MDRRFIEEMFPIKEVSEESVREKRINSGHISTIHIWWARRPLAVSRATIYASLIKNPEDSVKQKKVSNFIVDLSFYENSQKPIIDVARKTIFKNFGKEPPKILDPFGGGGSIPLEALRLGCETYTGDYNPVAVKIQKCILEYTQKYIYKKTTLEKKSSTTTDLLKDVEKWSKWIQNELEKELKQYYKSKETETPNGFIWAKTIPCQNPSCGIEIPLMRGFWLSKKRKISLLPFIFKNTLKFKIVGTGYDEIPKNFNPNKGSVSRAIVICPLCGYTTDDKLTRKLFADGESAEQLMVVTLYNKGKTGKTYRVANQKDTEIFHKAEEYLNRKRKEILQEIGMDPIPDEDLPPTGTLGFRIQRYGLKKWGDLFNPRQKLLLLIICEKIKQAYALMINEGTDKEYSNAIVSYLALGLDRIADRNSRFSVWNTFAEKQEHVFGRNAIPMVFDYAESNVVEGNQGWKKQFDYILKCLENLQVSDKIPHIEILSAMKLPYTDQFFDAVITDPPYYDNIPYSYLSDFFYVWLKRIIGRLYPDLFSTPLTPKSEEIVAYPNIPGGPKKAKELFEERLKKSFIEINRVLKEDGIAVIVYAHKTTDGWETLINSLLDSGLIVTASWPIHTEMEGRLRATDSAALASSIYIVCRKWKKEPHESYSNVKKQMQEYLDKKLDFLWSQDIRGADFFISAIGSAIEVFGKYETITDHADNEIKVSDLLEDVRKIVSEYAIKKVLHGDIGGEISTMTRFYVLWRSAYGQAKVLFDDARKLATSLGINLEQEWNKGFIKKEKEFVRVIGPEDRDIDKIKEPTELIDVMHKTLLLWQNRKHDEWKKLLDETGFAGSDKFKRVAQAISETLPNDIQEKRLIDGFLTGFSDSDKSDDKQTKLF